MSRVSSTVSNTKLTCLNLRKKKVPGTPTVLWCPGDVVTSVPLSGFVATGAGRNTLVPVLLGVFIRSIHVDVLGKGQGTPLDSSPV